MRRTIGVALLALGLLVCAGPAGAQKKAEDESPMAPIGGLIFKDEFQLTVVNIDVFVRNKKGDAITGLTADDFRVYQNHDEKKITNFALYTEEVFASELAEPTPLPGVAAREIEPPPVAERPEIKPVHLVLFIDNENLRPFDRTRVLSQVRSFVREFMNPYTFVMVVSYQRSLKILQPFTQDSKAVVDAIRGQRKAYAARVDREAARQRLLKDMQYLRNERESGGDRSRNRGGRMRSAIYDQMRTFADETSHDLKLSLGALRQVTQMLSGLPGRRSIVHISSGLPMVPGKDLFHEYQSIYQDDAAVLPLEGRYNQRHEYRALISTANAQGVRFYTVDATGITVSAGVSAEYGQAMDPITATIGASNYQESLLYIAEGTGGLAVINANDVTDGLRKIRQDIFTYYSLGYSLASSGGDKVHSIKVEIPDHPEYRVRYRRSFVEKSLETKVRDTVMSALIFDVDDNPMKIDVSTANPAPAAEDRWIVPLSVSFPLDSIALLPEADEYVGRVVLFVAARDREGKQSDIQRRQHEIRLPAADYDSRRHERFVVDVQMLMEPGSYRVSAGLMDQITRQASYEVVTKIVGEGS